MWKFFTLTLWLLYSATSSQAQVTYGLEDAITVAQNALNAGQPDIAYEIAESLVKIDGADVEALIVLSRAANKIGLYDKAIRAGHAAWHRAKTDMQRYQAALVTAQALSASGARTRAQIWLRRATDAAPDDTLKSVAIRDFRYVRDRNPWTTNLSFGLSPSSNINNGSKSDTLEIDGLTYILSGDARALSGIEYQLGADTEFSHQISEKTWAYADAAYDGKFYSLSPDAKAQAPGFDAADLTYHEASLTFGLTTFLAPRLGPTDMSLTQGWAWSGGDLLARYTRFDLTQDFALTPRDNLQLALSAEAQNRFDASINDSVSLTGQAAWAHERRNRDSLHLLLGLRDTESDGAAIAHQAEFTTLSYSFAKPVAGAQIGLSLAFEARQYDMPLYTPDPRADSKTTFEITAFLPKFAYFGFAPELGVTAVQNRSNVSLYKSEDYGLSLSFRSAF